ncbi:hypothetical protein ECEC4436_4883, partial [Escherichia coli EC4436]
MVFFSFSLFAVNCLQNKYLCLIVINFGINC